jgi:hypothetical protein
MAARTAQPKSNEPERVEVQDLDTADPSRIGTLGSVMSGGEIEIGAPEEVVPQRLQQRGGVRMVKVRVNENIEEMSLVGGGRRMGPYKFEAGHEYMVPAPIAKELERNGKVWH